MSEYLISVRAEQAIEDIFVYTVSKFGMAQAEAYHEGLHRMFGLLADFPLMGLSADEFIPGMQKFRYQSHFVFYTQNSSTSVTIQHVIYARQTVRKHMFED